MRCPLLWALGLLAAGCSQTLFPADAHHTPYQRYAELRGAKPVAPDSGRVRVSGQSLRQRLAPLDEP